MKSLLIHKPTQNKYYLEVLGSTFNYCFIFLGVPIPRHFYGRALFGWLGLERGQDCRPDWAKSKVTSLAHTHYSSRGYLESNQAQDQNNKGHGHRQRVVDGRTGCRTSLSNVCHDLTHTHTHTHTHTWWKVLLNNKSAKWTNHKANCH